MNIWFNAIARAGGIEVPPDTGSNLARASKAHGNRPTLARRVFADIGGGASLQALESRVLRLGQALNTWRRRSTAVRELSALSDHTLKDIGLHRGEIRSVVHEMIRVSAATPGDPPTERKQVRRPVLAGTFLGAQPCEQPC